jgi:hypothetical protein
VAALCAFGCTQPASREETAPPRNIPGETESARLTRLEERIRAEREQIGDWQRALAAGRGHAVDEAKLETAEERLRSCREALDRLDRRVASSISSSPHGPTDETRPSEVPDLEREAIRIHGLAERAYRDGLDTLGRSPQGGGPP